jgi:hypothetical protein
LPTTVSKGAMGNILGVISPDDLRKWPALDPEDPAFQRDMASLGLGQWTPPPPRRGISDEGNRWVVIWVTCELLGSMLVRFVVVNNE